MAGDWIKMRGNLWDDPRVARLVDATDSSEAAIVGSLYWLWATADQHTEDGLMIGLTCKGIDRKTGVPGFAAALCSIEWLEESSDGVRIIDFVKHNGTSAKKRCQVAKRVANHASENPPATTKKGSKANAQTAPYSDETNAQLTQDDYEMNAQLTPIFNDANAVLTPSHHKTNAHSVSSALAREEIEKEIEKEEKGGLTTQPQYAHDEAVVRPSIAGAICVAMKAEGMTATNPSHPKLLVLIDKGADIGLFAGVARECAEKQKNFAYALAIVEGRMTDAAQLASTALAVPQQASETAYQRSCRLRVAEISPELARPAPSQKPNQDAADYFRSVNSSTILEIAK
jgi:hypothetical protein